MSGSLITLVSKGVQDVYLINNDGGSSLFKTVFTRHTNFSMAPRRLEITGQQPQAGGTSSIFIKNFGDLINYAWLEGSSTMSSHLKGTIFDLYIGGQKVDSHSFEFLTYAWQAYQAESYSKSIILNSVITNTCQAFMPLHFFFCDMQSFLPLVALSYHEVEIRITWGPNIVGDENIIPWANYIYLDTKERELMAQKPMEIIITQVQTVPFDIKPVTVIDMTPLSHPVKTIFFGVNAVDEQDIFTFKTAEFQVNGTQVFEGLSPLYFHVVQSFFHTNYATISYDIVHQQPNYTRLYMYNFCLNSTSFRPTGTCNFSRIDNSKLTLTGVTSSNTDLSGYLYAVNYNILKIQNGLGGILFSN